MTTHLPHLPEDRTQLGYDDICQALRESLETNNRLHRRLQKCEGADLRYERMRANLTAEVQSVAKWGRVRTNYWKTPYREACRLMRVAGVSSEIGPGTAYMHLVVMVGRLIAERDALRGSWWRRLFVAGEKGSVSHDE